MINSIYLAGPDVFLPNAKAHGEELKHLCRAYGFKAYFPLDNEIVVNDDKQLYDAIRKANLDMINSCDCVIANLSPFRGPEPDSGTVFEVGYAIGKEKKVVGYSSDMRSLTVKTRAHLKLKKNATHDDNGMEIENFDLTHNLMFSKYVITINLEGALKFIRKNMDVIQ